MENNIQLNFEARMRQLKVRSFKQIKTKGMQNIIILGAAILLFIIFTILNPGFIDKYNILSMTQSVAPYAILALGVTFVIATGAIDLSIGTVMIACAVIAGKLVTVGMPLFFAIPVMIIIGGIFGLLNGYLVAKLKLPAFIATLGTMMFSRGLAAILVVVPNIFFPKTPSTAWYYSTFSNLNNFPIGLVWVLVLMLVCMYLMYKCKIGRYILSIGSNEEATRLSGINTDKYKMMAYIICGLFAGIAGIFWSASNPTITTATGNGMELDAIAGVYIGGTSASGGIASIFGSILGSMILVIIRSGLNFVISAFDIPINSTYMTYAITGIIVVMAVLMDVIKLKSQSKVKIEKKAKKFKNEIEEESENINVKMDYIKSDKTLDATEKVRRLEVLKKEKENLATRFSEEYPKLVEQDKQETLSKELTKLRKG